MQYALSLICILTQANSKGLCDARPDPAAASAAFHAKLRSVNPNIKKLVENVRFHPSLVADEMRFQNIWADKFYTLNTSDYGSPSSRPRQYMADFVRLDALSPVLPLSPNMLLPPHRHCKYQHMPCVVAGMQTHRIPQVYDSGLKASSRLTSSECEVMQD